MRSTILLLLGAVALGLLTFFCVRTHGTVIEVDLTTRATAAVTAAGMSGLVLTADGRDLTATGVVKSPIGEAKALAAVRETYGVRVVHDRITVEAGPSLDDCELTAVAADAGIILQGIAPGRETLDALTTATERAVDAGGVEVAELALHPGMTRGMSVALPWLHTLTHAKASSTATLTRLTGETGDATHGEAALMTLLDAAPEGYRAEVMLKPSRPFAPEELWARIRPYGKGVLIGGIVASAAQRDAILAKATERYGTVHSALMVADVEGVDLAPGIAAGIPILQTLSNGRMHATPARFFLSGLTAEGQSFDAGQLEAIRSVLPPGATLDSDITTPLKLEDCQGSLNTRLAKEHIQFASASADIAPASDPLLKEIASTLRRCPTAHLRIEGHTDSQGDDAFNLDLSDRRSTAVHTRLVRLGMPSPRALAKGFGETRPIADNTTDAGRAQNRRIEFRLEESP